MRRAHNPAPRRHVRSRRKDSNIPSVQKPTGMLRRRLALLLPCVSAWKLKSQNAPLASKFLRYEDLPVLGGGPNHFRPLFNGELRTGFAVEAHETELGEGLAPHPPHRHIHEEVVVVRQGLLEVTIGERSARLGPGSVAFIASNEEHGWKNVGTGSVRYLLFALGPDWQYRQSVGSSYSRPK
jgi:mannose-6-phosphate isomerase-like protein (cupin superfamily)